MGTSSGGYTAATNSWILTGLPRNGHCIQRFRGPRFSLLKDNLSSVLQGSCASRRPTTMRPVHSELSRAAHLSLPPRRSRNGYRLQNFTYRREIWPDYWHYIDANSHDETPRGGSLFSLHNCQNGQNSVQRERTPASSDATAVVSNETLQRRCKSAGKSDVGKKAQSPVFHGSSRRSGEGTTPWDTAKEALTYKTISPQIAAVLEDRTESAHCLPYWPIEAIVRSPESLSITRPRDKLTILKTAVDQAVEENFGRDSPGLFDAKYLLGKYLRETAPRPLYRKVTDERSNPSSPLSVPEHHRNKFFSAGMSFTEGHISQASHITADVPVDFWSEKKYNATASSEIVRKIIDSDDTEAAYTSTGRSLSEQKADALSGGNTGRFWARLGARRDPGAAKHLRRADSPPPDPCGWSNTDQKGNNFDTMQTRRESPQKIRNSSVDVKNKIMDAAISRKTPLASNFQADPGNSVPSIPNNTTYGTLFEPLKIRLRQRNSGEAHTSLHANAPASQSAVADKTPCTANLSRIIMTPPYLLHHKGSQQSKSPQMNRAARRAARAAPSPCVSGVIAQQQSPSMALRVSGRALRVKAVRRSLTANDTTKATFQVKAFSPSRAATLDAQEVESDASKIAEGRNTGTRKPFEKQRLMKSTKHTTSSARRRGRQLHNALTTTLSEPSRPTNIGLCSMEGFPLSAGGCQAGNKSHGRIPPCGLNAASLGAKCEVEQTKSSLAASSAEQMQSTGAREKGFSKEHQEVLKLISDGGKRLSNECRPSGLVGKSNNWLNPRSYKRDSCIVKKPFESSKTAPLTLPASSTSIQYSACRVMDRWWLKVQGKMRRHYLREVVTHFQAQLHKKLKQHAGHREACAQSHTMAFVVSPWTQTAVNHTNHGDGPEETFLLVERRRRTLLDQADVDPRDRLKEILQNQTQSPTRPQYSAATPFRLQLSRSSPFDKKTAGVYAARTDISEATRVGCTCDRVPPTTGTTMSPTPCGPPSLPLENRVTSPASSVLTSFDSTAPISQREDHVSHVKKTQRIATRQNPQSDDSVRERCLLSPSVAKRGRSYVYFGASPLPSALPISCKTPIEDTMTYLSAEAHRAKEHSKDKCINVNCEENRGRQDKICDCSPYQFKDERQNVSSTSHHLSLKASVSLYCENHSSRDSQKAERAIHLHPQAQQLPVLESDEYPPPTAVNSCSSSATWESELPRAREKVSSSPPSSFVTSSRVAARSRSFSDVFPQSPVCADPLASSSTAASLQETPCVSETRLVASKSNDEINLAQRPLLWYESECRNIWHRWSLQDQLDAARCAGKPVPSRVVCPNSQTKAVNLAVFTQGNPIPRALLLRQQPVTSPREGHCDYNATPKKNLYLNESSFPDEHHQSQSKASDLVLPHGLDECEPVNIAAEKTPEPGSTVVTAVCTDEAFLSSFEFSQWSTARSSIDASETTTCGKGSNKPVESGTQRRCARNDSACSLVHFIGAGRRVSTPVNNLLVLSPVPKTSGGASVAAYTRLSLGCPSEPSGASDSSKSRSNLKIEAQKGVCKCLSAREAQTAVKTKLKNVRGLKCGEGQPCTLTMCGRQINCSPALQFDGGQLEHAVAVPKVAVGEIEQVTEVALLQTGHTSLASLGSPQKKRALQRPVSSSCQNNVEDLVVPAVWREQNGHFNGSTAGIEVKDIVNVNKIPDKVHCFRRTDDPTATCSCTTADFNGSNSCAEARCDPLLFDQRASCDLFLNPSNLSADYLASHTLPETFDQSTRPCDVIPTPSEGCLPTRVEKGMHEPQDAGRAPETLPCVRCPQTANHTDEISGRIAGPGEPQAQKNLKCFTAEAHYYSKRSHLPASKLSTPTERDGFTGLPGAAQPKKPLVQATMNLATYEKKKTTSKMCGISPTGLGPLKQTGPHEHGSDCDNSVGEDRLENTEEQESIRTKPHRPPPSSFFAAMEQQLFCIRALAPDLGFPMPTTCAPASTDADPLATENVSHRTCSGVEQNVKSIERKQAVLAVSGEEEPGCGETVVRCYEKMSPPGQVQADFACNVHMCKSLNLGPSPGANVELPRRLSPSAAHRRSGSCASPVGPPTDRKVLCDLSNNTPGGSVPVLSDEFLTAEARLAYCYSVAGYYQKCHAHDLQSPVSFTPKSRLSERSVAVPAAVLFKSRGKQAYDTGTLLKPDTVASGVVAEKIRRSCSVQNEHNCSEFATHDSRGAALPLGLSSTTLKPSLNTKAQRQNSSTSLSTCLINRNQPCRRTPGESCGLDCSVRVL